MLSDKEQAIKYAAATAGKIKTVARRLLGQGGRLLLVLVILAVGGGISFYWMTHKPTAKRRQRKSRTTLVEVSRVSPQSYKVVIKAMGTVIPARSIQLAPRVGGQVVDISPKFVPGGRFQANERILQVDPKDYQLAVQQRADDLAKAQCELKLEMGQQSVARRESELLGETIKEEDKELLLRQPQLAMNRAMVAAAAAALEQSQLDLKRTSIAAPFNAMIQSRSVDLGSQVNAGTAIASLVGTDEYWVKVSVPVDQLKWISIPGIGATRGSHVYIHYESSCGPDAGLEGSVSRLMAELEPQGRMAQLLVAVKDPLLLKSAAVQRFPLILNSYVRVEIQSRDVPQAIRVPRTALRDGSRVWVMRADNTLDIREVKIVWSGNECVYVTDGLRDGDMLITSNLTTPVQGMTLHMPKKRRQAKKPGGRK
ncbi:MAG: efflux RND transporter periplasmic adaptor subunit [Phycisphaerae bacterium]|nr:efflux RND transporter periplasmic adaptor subunit [Phycisphaerae bacterium]